MKGLQPSRSQSDSSAHRDMTCFWHCQCRPQRMRRHQAHQNQSGGSPPTRWWALPGKGSASQGSSLAASSGSTKHGVCCMRCSLLEQWMCSRIRPSIWSRQTSA